MSICRFATRGRWAFALAALAGLGITAGALAEHHGHEQDRDPLQHEIHDPDRPQPPKVDPGPAGPPVPAPSDAIVLFNGSSLGNWEHGDGAEPRWEITDEGEMRVIPGEGDIRTKQRFGDAQLHVEFWCDPDSPGSGQSRSNSGVFFGSYEVQVLDTYENVTYPDGMAGSLYGQYPPLVNASRPAGEWQTFDIVYHAPRFGEGDEVLEPARFTVFHNNVLVQYHEPLVGPTSHGDRASYRRHGDLHIRLQDHDDDPIKFRNIWVRELN